MDEMVEYYNLKQKYHNKLNARKNRIKNGGLSTRDKISKLKGLIPVCINCNKPGGTTFEEKNGRLKAVCGAKTPCNLNINIKRKIYDNVIDLEHKNDKLSENLKMRIIMTKLDYLFGLNTSKEDTVDRFNKLKTELAQLSALKIMIHKKYGDIISGINRDPLLNDENILLANEIDELKKIYNEYLADPKPGYITTMLEKYVTVIVPTVKKIQEMQYKYYTIECINPDDKIDKTYVLYKNTYNNEDLEYERV